MSPCTCHQKEKQRKITSQRKSAERKSDSPIAYQEQGPKVGQLAAMETAANQGTAVRRAAQLREALNGPVQRRAAATGLGENLQAGLEQISGMDLSGVRVHYNSPKPAQLQALAYTQGQDIHVAPGQEKHLPHEGWHVVQQMQGRVQPTMELAGSAINDSPALEREADVMGVKALQRKVGNLEAPRRIQDVGSPVPVQRTANRRAPSVIQRVNDDFSGQDLTRLQQIAVQMGVDPNKLSFKNSDSETSRAEGNTIYVGRGLLRESPARLKFVIGHELSHYKTADTWPSSLLNLGLVEMMAAGALGTLYGGPMAALVGGLLGFGGELAAGGGLFNALITGGSMAGMLGLGPLGSWLGGTAGGVMGGTLGGLSSLPFISKLLEMKADLHSAKNVGARGGIEHFGAAMQENTTGAPLLKEGNALFDPFHPPLSFRKGYLELLR